MKVLVIADHYDPDSETSLAEMVSLHQAEAVVTAGDLSHWALAGIDALGVPAMGVYGNHCDGTYLDTLGMTNLHLRRIELHGISFVGLQGCVRYKVGPGGIMYTQDENRALV